MNQGHANNLGKSLVTTCHLMCEKVHKALDRLPQDYEEFANALMLLHDSGGVIDVASRESTDDTKGGLKRTGDDLIGAAANQSSVDPWSGGSLF